MAMPMSSNQLGLGVDGPVSDAGKVKRNAVGTSVGAHSNGFISKKLRARSYLRVCVHVKPVVDNHRRGCDGCKRDDERSRRN